MITTITKPEAEAVARILATFHGRIAAIQARDVPRLNYVLAWGDGRFVRITDGAATVTGFEHATFFGDRAAAQNWIKRGLTDGARFAPHVVPAFNAKQGAIFILQDAVKVVEAHAMLRIES